jgi:hypothetical protein
MTRVHCLKHIEGLCATDFTHDDTVRAHSQTVSDKLALRNLSTAFDIDLSSFESYDVRLL